MRCVASDAPLPDHAGHGRPLNGQSRTESAESSNCRTSFRQAAQGLVSLRAETGGGRGPPAAPVGSGIKGQGSRHCRITISLPEPKRVALKALNPQIEPPVASSPPSSPTQEVEDVSGALKDLRDVGVKLSIDDFGKGFSSLSHIQRFPFDRIKLDKMFIAEMQQSERAVSIVKAALADALCMAVTAEGVETSEQLDGLRTLGCEEVQGFLLAKPLPLSNLLALISARSTGGP